MRITLQDRIRLIQRSAGVRCAVPRNQCGAEKCIHRVGQICNRCRDAQPFDLGAELRPTLKAVFARQHKLRICERNTSLRWMRVMDAEAAERIGVVIAAGLTYLGPAVFMIKCRLD